MWCIFKQHNFFIWSRLWRIFFLFFIVARLHACAVCIALPAGLAVVPTQGFYFAFAVFLLFLEKKICFGSEGVARNKLVFGMLKHDHVSFQILTRYFYHLDFGTKPLINTLLIVFSFLFFLLLFFLTLIFA